jgi:peptide/nickel transport system permease protein
LPSIVSQRSRPLVRIAYLVLVVAALAALLNTLALDPYAQEIQNRLIPPGGRGHEGRLYALGSDALGRDVLARLLFGARVSLLVATVSVTGAGIVGFAVGLISGFVGGRTDRILMRLVDLQLSFPFLILAIGALAAVGPSIGVVIGLFIIARWPAYARIGRGAALEVKEREFVLAARAVGARDLRILLRHVAPTCVGPVMVLASFEVATVIIYEATLGFLGVGVPPPIPTWGNMLAAGRAYLRTAWWLAILPGAAISTCALAANLLGDSLRDYLDPKLRRR